MTGSADLPSGAASATRGASSAGGGLFIKHGPLLAALLAAAASLPGLWVPFLADDWALLAAAPAGWTGGTPFGYFRPLSMATLSLDRRLWGLSPALFHLTNLLLIAAAAALAVVVIRRLTRNPLLASLAGVLFALHPYHVENAGWIAARADPLFALPFLGAFLAYDRWRGAPRGLPYFALLLFEAALLCKEGAASLPVLLVLLGVLCRERRIGTAEAMRGVLPMLVLALAHFLLVRPAALGGAGLAPLSGFGARWVRNLLSFGTAALLPGHIEYLETRPRLWGLLALIALLVLGLAALLRSGRIPRSAWGATVAFGVLLAPSLLSFQERYFFLPSAASSLAVSALLLASGRRTRNLLTAVLGAGWILALGVHWIGWLEAGRAGSSLMGDLARASRDSRIREIVVANMPYRIHGTALAGNTSLAVVLSGGRPVAIRPALSLDYPDGRADAVEDFSVAPPGAAGWGAEVRLRIREGVFSRYVNLPPAPAAVRDEPPVAVTLDGKGGAVVRIAPSPGGERAAFLWRKGKLERLF